MATPVVGRTSELDAIERLLDALDEGPAALLLEGEPGIGKTTLLLAATEIARLRGLQVLTCTGSPSDARLAHAALADMLRDVDDDEIESLPAPQREALDAARLRIEPESGTIDPLAICTASLSVLESMAAKRPVLVVIDDLPWLDNPTARVVEFCSRRITGQIGVIAAQRTGTCDPDRPLLALSEPDRTEALQIVGLAQGELGQVLRDRALEPLPRQAISRIGAASGGNPFYALELSRSLDADAAPAAALPLPASLEEVVDAKVAGLADEVDETLLATAALADPTPDLLARAFGPDAIAALEAAEERELVIMDGERVRFAHPLLAHGIYGRASAPRRREMHRRLSGVVSDPEERARHLAHARVLPDAIEALDDAARYVRMRGAPDAAAELLELALELGGGPELLVRAAEHQFDAGEAQRSYELATRAIETLDAGEERAVALRLLGELRFHGDSYTGAREALERARTEAGPNDRLQVTIGVELTHVYFQLGLWETAAETGESVLAAARRVGEPGLIAQTLGTTALVDLCLGRGLDEARLDEAIRLEDPNLRTGIAGAPSQHAFFVFLWAARFDEARAAIARLRRRYAERGEEPALAFISAADAQLECWSGNLVAAGAAADEALERGLLQMGTTGRALGLWVRSLVDAYSGRIEEARPGAEESMELFERAGSRNFPLWPLTTLGFIELSVGDYEAAAARLAPAALKAISDGRREPAADGTLFIGDAAEALVGASRVEEAEPIVSLLEERGAALDRVWAIAVGARCRGLIHASQGEVEEAERAVTRALAVHDRLPMPIERARSLLVLGRIRRRLRKRRAAKEALDEALEIFEKAGSPRWADQTRGEIDAIGLRPAATGDELTPAEERVANLVATGLSNKEVAAALVVSPKTVEAHLGRTYRKLGIRRRAELGARMAQGED